MSSRANGSGTGGEMAQGALVGNRGVDAQLFLHGYSAVRYEALSVKEGHVETCREDLRPTT